MPTAADAARNNAEWCDLVCRTHGAGGTFGRDTRSTSIRSPRYYPDALTLTGVAGDRQRVTDRRALDGWETAWADPDEATTLFRPALLDDPNVVVLCDRVAGELVDGGAILNRAAGVVGLTNLFTRSGDLDAVWNAAVSAASAASACFPNEPIVGYESGDDLAAAQRRGFVSLGPLRVWINDGV